MTSKEHTKKAKTGLEQETNISDFFPFTLPPPAPQSFVFYAFLKSIEIFM